MILDINLNEYYLSKEKMKLGRLLNINKKEIILNFIFLFDILKIVMGFLNTSVSTLSFFNAVTFI